MISNIFYYYANIIRLSKKITSVLLGTLVYGINHFIINLVLSNIISA